MPGHLRQNHLFDERQYVDQGPSGYGRPAGQPAHDALARDARAAPLIAREIWRICSLIKDSGISSVIVDKNWKHVTQITDRNVILVKGEVVFEGTSEALIAQPELLTQHLGV